MTTETVEAEATTVVQPNPTISAPMATVTRAMPSKWVEVEWTAERIALAKKAVCPPTATDAEFEFFIAWCRRTGLDPFIKQAYLVERWDTASNSKRHEPMAAEAGMAARADAQADFLGMRSGVVYAGDEFILDEDTQTIVHRWTPELRAKSGNRVLGAWAHGRRIGREVEITYLTLESRIGKKRDGTVTQFWARDPAGQLRKCARADQYRRLYPNLFAGVYIEGEVLDDREVDITPPSAALAATSVERKKALKASVDQRLAATAAPPASAPSTRAPAPTPPGTKQPAPALAQVVTSPEGPVVGWGKHASRLLGSLTAEELAWYLSADGAQKAAKAVGAEAAEKLRAEYLDEAAARETAATGEGVAVEGEVVS